MIRRCAFFVFVMAFAACSSAPDRTATPSPASTAPIDPLLVVSGDASGVVVIDFAALARTPLAARFAGRIRGLLDRDRSLATHCQLDVMSAIEKMWIGVPRPDAQGAMSIRGVLDRPAFEACVQRILRAQGQTIEITADGPVALVKTDDETLHAAWLDDRTSVVFQPPMQRADVDARLAAPGPAGDLATFVRQADHGAAVWMAMVGDSPGGELGAFLGSAPVGVHASVHYTGDLRITAGLRFADAGAATAVVARLRGLVAETRANPLLAALREHLDAVVIEAAAIDVEIQVALDARQLDRLADVVELFLP
jgi:hypothetical protein